ncbi:MAG: superoxide dismutase [Ignavibacteria bacterium CG2_30_36_16]|nr:superoxide dismutase [Ignavibacteria bacterium]OIP59814.1 MAG: superoxide dismutase [Ignavibacteria bacterium CG2_30_36_16]PJA99438.1 MAG: superoxide dismutase [Ignavibacteria bacterium CG_4_9_14_3_um_filter_36_18]
MKILAIEKEISDLTLEQLFPFLNEEAIHAWELFKSGFIREMYFRHDRHTVILILEAESIEKAELVLRTLPLVEKGFIDFELIALRAYDGFERLFAQS